MPWEQSPSVPASAEGISYRVPSTPKASQDLRWALACSGALCRTAEECRGSLSLVLGVKAHPMHLHWTGGLCWEGWAGGAGAVPWQQEDAEHLRVPMWGGSPL